MKKFISIYFITGFFLFFNLNQATSIVFEPGDKETVLSLNGKWKFYITSEKDTAVENNFFKKQYQDAGWKTIDVPTNWELQGFEEPTYFFPDRDVTAFYRETIKIPGHFQGKQLVLHFDGVSFA